MLSFIFSILVFKIYFQILCIFIVQFVYIHLSLPPSNSDSLLPLPPKYISSALFVISGNSRILLV